MCVHGTALCVPAFAHVSASMCVFPWRSMFGCNGGKGYAGNRVCVCGIYGQGLHEHVRGGGQAYVMEGLHAYVREGAACIDWGGCCMYMSGGGCMHI